MILERKDPRELLKVFNFDTQAFLKEFVLGKLAELSNSYVNQQRGLDEIREREQDPELLVGLDEGEAREARSMLERRKEELEKGIHDAIEEATIYQRVIEASHLAFTEKKDITLPFTEDKYFIALIRELMRDAANVVVAEGTTFFNGDGLAVETFNQSRARLGSMTYVLPGNQLGVRLHYGDQDTNPPTPTLRVTAAFLVKIA